MRLRYAAMAAGLALGAAMGPAKAAFVVDIQEEQFEGIQRITVTGHGSLNTAGLDFFHYEADDGPYTFNYPSVDVATGSYIGIGLYFGGVPGVKNGYNLYYAKTPNLQQIGPGPADGQPKIPDDQDATGPYFFSLFHYDGQPFNVYTSTNYKSGTDFGTATMYFSNRYTTYESLGVTPGRYYYPLYNPTTGAFADSYTINIGVSAVPLPASAPMFGAALLALSAFGFGLKRKKAAAAKMIAAD